MGVFTYIDEYTSAICPARLFRALIIESDNLIPKLLPQHIKSIEFIQGDGGPGSIRQINFHEGHQPEYVKIRVVALDPASFSYTYALIEGDGLMDKLEGILHELQFVAGPNGGSINKMKTTYTTKGDVVLSEEEAKEGKEKALDMCKVAEAYLLEKPAAYA